jgi:hypothetical protein
MPRLSNSFRRRSCGCRFRRHCRRRWCRQARRRSYTTSRYKCPRCTCRCWCRRCRRCTWSRCSSRSRPSDWSRACIAGTDSSGWPCQCHSMPRLSRSCRTQSCGYRCRRRYRNRWCTPDCRRSYTLSRHTTRRAHVVLGAGVPVVAHRAVGLRAPRCLAGRGRALLTLVGRVYCAGGIARPADQTAPSHNRVAAGPVAVAHVGGAGNLVVAAIRCPGTRAACAHVALGAGVPIAARGPGTCC